MHTTAPPTSTAPGPQSFGDTVIEIVTLANTVFVAGPPVATTLVVSVLCGLLLAGPFLLIVTIVVALAAAAGLVVLAGAVLAAPFLVARRVSRRLAQQRLVAQAERVAPLPAIPVLAGSLTAQASR